METGTIQGAINTAFKVALLFGCDTMTAEAAVLDAIDACEDVFHRSFLIGAVASTLRRRGNSENAFGALQLLPAELRRLFRLQPILRDCFVLRILLGLSPEVCTGLLNISVTEFADAFYAALQQLPLFSTQNVDSCDDQRSPMRAVRRSHGA
jgi:hypothetical protein